MEILALDNRHRQQVNDLVRREWNGPLMVSRGAAIDTTVLPGFVALLEGGLAGLLLYRLDGSDCEVVVHMSLVQRQGVGSALIRKVRQAAGKEGCRQVWLITTNDNTRAIRYYQTLGFDLTAVHLDAMEASRRLKPSIPQTGIDGIPIRHEFEFAIPPIV